MNLPAILGNMQIRQIKIEVVTAMMNTTLARIIKYLLNQGARPAILPNLSSRVDGVDCVRAEPAEE